MRVLMVSWEYPPVMVGGLGRHVHALAEALARRGDEVTVLARSDGTAVPAEEVVGGVRVVRVPPDPVLLRLEDDLLAWTLALNHALTRAGLRVAAEEPPDVVHAHDWLVAHAASTLTSHLGVPLVATVHATEAGRHQGWLPEPLNRSIHSVEWWLTTQAHRVITCSASMRWEVSRLFEVPADRVDVVANGIDVARWCTTPEQVAAARARWAPDGPLVSYTGRLVYEKGVRHLLAAVPRLRRRHPALRVVVAGTGPEEAALKEQSRALRLGRAVRFAGFVPDADLAALVAASDCAVVPSVYEPFGLVALEAAAAGTPAVVSDVGGLREIVPHRRTGLRVAPGDPAALAEAVDELVRDEVLGRRLVNQARAALEQDHAWSAVAERTAEVYRRAALSRAQTGRTVPRPPAWEGNLLLGAP